MSTIVNIKATLICTYCLPLSNSTSEHKPQRDCMLLTFDQNGTIIISFLHSHDRLYSISSTMTIKSNRWCIPFYVVGWLSFSKHSIKWQQLGNLLNTIVTNNRPKFLPRDQCTFRKRRKNVLIYNLTHYYGLTIAYKAFQIMSLLFEKIHEQLRKPCVLHLPWLNMELNSTPTKMGRYLQLLQSIVDLI